MQRPKNVNADNLVCGVLGILDVRIMSKGSSPICHLFEVPTY